MSNDQMAFSHSTDFYETALLNGNFVADLTQTQTQTVPEAYRMPDICTISILSKEFKVGGGQISTLDEIQMNLCERNRVKKVRRKLDLNYHIQNYFQKFYLEARNTKFQIAKCETQTIMVAIERENEIKIKYKISIVTILNKTNKIKYNIVNKFYWCSVYVT